MPMPYYFGLPLPTIMVIASIIVAGIVHFPFLHKIKPLRLLSALVLFSAGFSWMTWCLMELGRSSKLEISFRVFLTITFLLLSATEIHFATENKKEEKKLVGAGGKTLAIIKQANRELKRRDGSNPPKEVSPEKSVLEQLNEKRNKRRFLKK